MIFSKEIDLSLWYILKTNKKNGELIRKFINEIPKDFINKIKESLTLEKEISDFILIGKTCYSFSIDEDGSLTLTKKILNDKYYDDVIELLILPKELKILPNFCDEWLGTLSTNIKITHYSDDYGSYDCQEFEYNHYNTPFGSIVGYNYEFHEKNIPLYKYINSNKIPEDINLNNLPKTHKLLKK